ncbi:MAG: hypothetical protein AAGE76_09280 [Pseudomonadota bacterium]
MNDDANKGDEFRRRARAYLNCAKLALDAGVNEADPPLQAPTLHLIAHGYELALKAAFLDDGKDERWCKDNFGHNLIKSLNKLRDKKSVGLEPVLAVEVALAKLSGFHTCRTAFVLR